MNLHEYQAKELFRQYGLSVANGVVVFSPEEFDVKVKTLNPSSLVVKAQIHAGGRGKGGGVKLANSVLEAKQFFNNMFNSVLVTKQTGPNGQLVRRVYIEEGQKIKKEYYLSLVLDRVSRSVVIIFSSEGGMDIEEVAHNSPEKIIKVTVDPLIGMQDFYVRKLTFAAGFPLDKSKKISVILKSLYNLFVERDASQIEINPLIENDEGEFMALDAKINFDDNALYRQPLISTLRDTDEEDPSELLASKYGLNYVKMDGKIGCVVNGAGLAMATMDIIKYYGSSPANFLDVGGSATLETVTQAFKIILSDERVEGILVNIFGGIMRCNIIAEGIVNAVKIMKLNVPVVVRLVGTNYELGKKILSDSGLDIVSADGLDEAAKLIVDLVKKRSV